MAVQYQRRRSSPSTTNKFYIKRDKPYYGYNRCMLINSSNGSVLPNCVGYAWGRYCEEQGITDCRLSRGDAGNWWYKNDGYQRGQTPKLGAVICWSNPKTGGHVAIVEKINSNGTLETTNSAYNGKRWYEKTLTPPNYYMGRGYTFQGFIYSDTEFIDSDTPVPPEPQAPRIKNKFKWVLYSKKLRNKRLTE